MSNVDIYPEELNAMNIDGLKRNLLLEIVAANKDRRYATIHLDNIQAIRERLKRLGVPDWNLDTWKMRK